MKRAIRSLLCVLVIFAFGASFVAQTQGTDTASVQTKNDAAEEPKILGGFQSSLPEEYVAVAENGKWQLEYREDISAVRFVSNQTNTVWHTVVTRDVYDLDWASATWLNYMQSVAAIKYIYRTDTRGNVMTAYSAAEDTTVTATLLEDGLRLQMDYTGAQIRLTMDILLDPVPRVVLPENGLEEYGEFVMLSVEVFPFFDAAPQTADGYLFYPDGSGMLSYFDKTADKSFYTSALTLDVYGPTDQFLLLDDEADACAMLPVLGIKHGTRAMLGAITQGDADASIHISPGLVSSAVPLNRIYFELHYRYSYRIYLSNLNVNGKDLASTLYGLKAEDNFIAQQREIRLFLLEGEEADYSGMARAYRQYLIESGKLQASPLQENFNLLATFFMGTYEKGALAPAYITMTTYEQAADIINECRAEGITDARFMLRGWDKAGWGVYPSSYAFSGKLGGTSALRQLMEAAPQTALEINLNAASSGRGGYSKSRDVLLMGNANPVTDELETEFLLTPEKSIQKFSQAQQRLTKLNAGLLAVESIGQTLYKHFDSNNSTQRRETAEIFSSFAQGALVQGGNQYVLSGAWALYDIPTETAMHHIADESIPWYQMVVHDSIPYAAQAGNLSYDLEEEMLRWLEYGCIPYFELTAENPSRLKNTEYIYLFTSQFSEWKERVIEVYKEMMAAASQLEGTIQSHHRDGDVVQVVYENRAQLWINYGEEAAPYPGGSIPPHAYRIESEVLS